MPNLVPTKQPNQIGLKIALNGCFDIFHKAHQSIINRAMFLSQKGEVRIFLNSDKSIKNLKGSSRPINNVNIRIKNLKEAIQIWKSNNQEVITSIVIFDTEEILLKKLNIFNPDMLIKGSDHTDLTKITGFSKHPILIVPRGTDKNNKDISTSLLEANNAN